MNDTQKLLVQASFEKVIRIADVAAELFYARLFMLDPALKPMFRGDMKAQGKKLMDALRAVVHGIQRPEKIAPILRDLGRRHVAYGVKDEHYGVVGSALLWTLERGLGDDATPDVLSAWASAYDLVATVMKEGAAEVCTPSRAVIRPSAAAPLSVRGAPLSVRGAPHSVRRPMLAEPPSVRMG
jgi:hemoglobin-like flavoprotein